eukprot:TRINITY_DN4456_c0_g1_i1.p1 TRINITY_DN4456_c0_g1~~TRINITY_DN4456_c0_g1_i1.p1  ORF type:complete len:265 (+),score=55.03 TRINITY_DN4456_c0_g1_i1:53-796(+)
MGAARKEERGSGEVVGDCAAGSIFYGEADRRRLDAVVACGAAGCRFGTPVTMVVEPQKLYARKPGVLRVRVVKEWRDSLGLTQAEVFSAVKDCTCCNPESLYEELACPACCKNGGQVVAVTKLVEFCDNNNGSGMVEYIFSLTSFCTSSSMHLQSPMVVLVGAIGGVQVKSSPFSLLSREWKGRRAPVAGMDEAELPRRRHTRRAAPLPQQATREDDDYTCRARTRSYHRLGATYELMRLQRCWWST